MSSILEEFACGNLNPNERNFRNSPKFARTSRALFDAEKTLRCALDEPQKILLDGFMKAQSDLDYLESIDRFTHGYRLGVLMTVEVFQTTGA